MSVIWQRYFPFLAQELICDACLQMPACLFYLWSQVAREVYRVVSWNKGEDWKEQKKKYWNFLKHKIKGIWKSEKKTKAYDTNPNLNFHKIENVPVLVREEQFFIFHMSITPPILRCPLLIRAKNRVNAACSKLNWTALWYAILLNEKILSKIFGYTSHLPPHSSIHLYFFEPSSQAQLIHPLAVWSDVSHLTPRLGYLWWHWRPAENLFLWIMHRAEGNQF